MHTLSQEERQTLIAMIAMIGELHGSCLTYARFADAMLGLFEDIPGFETISPASALRMVQTPSAMMWVLDERVAAPALASPASAPVLGTETIEGRQVRVLRAPGPATASARTTLIVESAAGPASARANLLEQALPNGARMLAFPQDTAVPPVAGPAPVERVIDPAQPGTRLGDLPVHGTAYRVITPR